MVNIVIPMSGIGKRFRIAGYKEPKSLIKVDGKLIIEHIVNLFDREKDNYIFICNEYDLQNTQMKDLLKSICPNCNIYQVPVDNRKGPVHAVSLIFDKIPDEEKIIVSYCDYGTFWNYKNFLNDVNEKNSDGAVVCYKGFHPHMLGKDQYAFLKETIEGSRLMESIQEKKPFTEDRMSEYASNGTYYFKSGIIMKKYFKRLLDLGITVNNEYYVSMVYNLLVKNNLKVSIFEIENMLQWGTPSDLENYIKWSDYFKNIIKTQDEFIDRNNTTIILPLAGHGSRFSKENYKYPKPLLPINNKPMFIQAVNCLPKSRYHTFICLDEHNKKYSLNNSMNKYYPNSNILNIDTVTSGQACTTELGLKNFSNNFEDSILISACDNGVYYDVKKYQEMVDDTNIDIIVWTFKDEQTSTNNPNMYAWLDVDQDDFVKSVSCKKFNPDIHNLKTSHVIIGTIFYRKSKYFLDGLNKNYQENIKTNGEFYVDDVLNQNIKLGLKVKAFQVENYICWGTPNDYKTYLYWQNFFNKCNWHPYKKELDITNK